MIQEVFPLSSPSGSLRAEDFCVTAASSAAYRLLTNWPQWPGPIVLLRGEAGSGKTHLAHIWAQLANAQFCDAEILEQFMEQHIQGREPHCIVEALETADPLALFHLLNRYKTSATGLLLTTRRPRFDTERWPADLVSRLHSLPSVTLAPPDDDLVIALLTKGFADRQVKVEPGVLRYLLLRIERSYTAIFQFIENADAAALKQSRPITLSLVKEVLEKL
jgi:chromosomal replication initiation ATPase DnaA